MSVRRARIEVIGSVVKVLTGVLAATAVAYGTVYIVLAVLRLSYPFELEWMEGAAVDHVLRILEGHKLYVTPSLEFVPFVYTPLYFYLSAFVTTVVGEGFLPLRLVSLLASIGCMAIVFRWVKRETSSVVAAIISAGLFAACYRVGGAWYDVGRADSLCLFLLLAGLYRLRYSSTGASLAVSGILFGLSFLAKQTGLIVALPMMLYALLAFRLRSMWFVFAVLVVIGGSTWVLDHVHNGWYYYYVFSLPGTAQVVPENIAAFWSKDIIPVVPLGLLLTVFFLIRRAIREKLTAGAFFVMMAVGMIAAAWVVRSHYGAYANTLVPAYALVSLLFGMGLREALGMIHRSSVRGRYLLEMLLLLVCCWQFYNLRYDFSSQVPTQVDREAGERFIVRLAEVDGEVLVPYHGYLPRIAGKKSSAHKAAINAVISGGGERAEGLQEEITKAIRSQEFGAIVIDAGWFEGDVKAAYTRARIELFEHPTVFYPVTGLRTRPRYMFIPRTRLGF